MLNLKNNLILIAVFFASTANATTMTLDLVQLSKSLKVANVFDQDPTKPPPRRGGLMELKAKQFHRDWAACRDLATKLQPKNKDVEGWVAVVRLECAMGAYFDKKDIAGLEKTFNATREDLFHDKAWGVPLRDSWARAGLALATATLKKNPKQAEKIYESILDRWEMTDEENAQAFSGLGQIALARKDEAQALFFFKESVDKYPTHEAQQHLADLRDHKAPQKSSSDDDSADDSSDDSAVPSPLGAEAEAEPMIQQLLAQNHRPEAMKKSIEVLNRFPLGQYSKKNKERVQELLTSAVDSNDPETPILITTAKEADPARLVEWAGVLQRRGDDMAALQLAEKAAEAYIAAPNDAQVLWIAGRSAYFIGDWEKAGIYFDRILQFFSASDEAAEAAFRLGMIQIHQGNYQTAVRYFDKVIGQNKQRWDLNARYWRVRALEKTDPKTFAESRDDLIAKFPFTYYGLRLRAEANNGVLEFPKNDRSPYENNAGKLTLVGAQKVSWQRFKKLSEEGWIIEAQSELRQLPMPSEPWGLMLWGKVFARTGQYASAIFAVSHAMDDEETLRHPRYLEDAYPKAYDRWISPSAKKNDINPTLIRSLVRQESAFGLKALSTSSAMGLMQLIPPTASDMARELKLDVSIPADMYRPDVNVPMGTLYLAKMLSKYNGNVPMALAAYNAGPKRIDRWMSERPELSALMSRNFVSWEDELWFDELPTAETSFYVKAILRNILLNRLMDQGPVKVTPAFWADLRHFSPVAPTDEVKHR